MTRQPIESRAITKIAEDYRRRGYNVAVTPTGPEIPEFLAGYQPDIIARSPTESVVVEIKVGTRTSDPAPLPELEQRARSGLASPRRSSRRGVPTLLEHG